jgi:hypothetical protein
LPPRCAVGQYRRMGNSESDSRLLRLFGVSTLDDARAATIMSVCHLFALDARATAAVLAAEGLENDTVDHSARIWGGQRRPDLHDVAHFPADAKQVLGGAEPALAAVYEWRARVIPWLDRARQPSADVLDVLAERLNNLSGGVRAANTADAIARMARRGEAGNVRVGEVPGLPGPVGARARDGRRCRRLPFLRSCARKRRGFRQCARPLRGVRRTRHRV